MSELKCRRNIFGVEARIPILRRISWALFLPLCGARSFAWSMSILGSGVRVWRFLVFAPFRTRGVIADMTTLTQVLKQSGPLWCPRIFLRLGKVAVVLGPCNCVQAFSPGLCEGCCRSGRSQFSPSGLPQDRKAKRYLEDKQNQTNR